MTAVGAEQSLSILLDHALACDRYDLTDAHLTAIFALESRLAKLPGGDTAVTRWLAACRRELENRTAEAPQEPTDYRRADKLSCKCADCRALSAFLADPNRPQARFPPGQGTPPTSARHHRLQPLRLHPRHRAPRQSPHARVYENHGVVRSGLPDLQAGPAEPVPDRCAGAQEGLNGLSRFLGSARRRSPDLAETADRRSPRFPETYPLQMGSPRVRGQPPSAASVTGKGTRTPPAIYLPATRSP